MNEKRNKMKLNKGCEMVSHTNHLKQKELNRLHFVIS